MKIAMCQMSNEGTMEANLKKSLNAIKEAALHNADLILFPEVQLTEFFPQFPDVDRSEYQIALCSDTVKAFQEACRKNNIMAVPNLYLKDEEYSNRKKAYDASMLIGQNGKILGIQKMVHIAQAEFFYEQDYYLPSDEGFQVFDTVFGKIGIVVCFDRHYPESVRTETLKGADLILIPTVNTRQEPMEMFEQEIRVQAFQNSVYIAMCNRVGHETEMEFAGESIVVSPEGMVIEKADDTEQIIYTDIDIRESQRIRNKKPYTSLRRKEFYL